MELKPIKLEKFSVNKYKTYEAKGIPMRLVSERGRDCTIAAYNVGENKDELLIEETYESYSGHTCKTSYYCNQRGKGYNTQLYIWTGFIEVNKGDMYIDYWSCKEEKGMFFYGFFDGICRCEKQYGYGCKWEMDSYGHQFSGSHTFAVVIEKDHKPHYMRLATEEEKTKYWELLLKAGYERHGDYPGSGLHEVPRVGHEYWSVEMEKGTAYVVHHEAPKTEDERPFGHCLCYTNEENAKEKADHINDKRFHY